MKKIILLILLNLALVACSNSNTTEQNTANSEKVKVLSLDSKGEEIEVEVPKNPKKVAVLDLATLDTINKIGKGDTVAGFIKGSKAPNLDSYYENDSIVNLGGAKEIDIEKLMELQPEIIFSSGRLAEQYDKLSQIAPVVYYSPNPRNGKTAYTLIKENIVSIASIWGLEKDVESELKSYDERVNAIYEKSKDKSALIALVTKGSINLLSTGARTSIISTDLGFKNLNPENSDTHGNNVSFETLLEINPEYLFVLDRDAVVSSSEATQLAKDILNNEIVHQTEAYKNNKIAYLDPATWYLVEGGFNSLDIMLKDIENIIK